MERVRALTDQLEAGITGLFQSGQYAAYLQSLSKLHHYSYGNIFLIKLQCSHASMVAGYGDWKRKFGRHVKAGETGITILAPCPYWARDEVEETGPDGQTIKEQKWVKKTGFTTATVFDVSQTEGRELPSLGVESLTGTVEGYEKLLSTLKSISPVPVSEGPLPPGVHGAYYHAEQKITLSPGMSEAQTIKTLVHEIAHAKLHALPVEGGIIVGAHEKDRRTREVEAESVAYTVCQYLDMDTTPDYRYSIRPKEVIARFMTGYCELCCKNELPVMIYQVKNLKSLSGNEPWEQFMLKKRRKTLIVCEDCYKTITNS